MSQSDDAPKNEDKKPKLKPAGAANPSQRAGYVSGEEQGKLGGKRQKEEKQKAEGKRQKEEKQKAEGKSEKVEVNPYETTALPKPATSHQPPATNNEPPSILKPMQQPPVPSRQPPKANRQKLNAATQRFAGSKLARAFFVGSLLVSVLFFGLVLVGAGGYIYIAGQLPSVADLEAKQSVVASSKVYDRNGALLVELIDPSSKTAGRRTRVSIDQMSERVKQATIATEDPNFYRYNVGFDPIAIVRALYYVWLERDVVSGGSTITQQVARNLLLSPEERASRSPLRKIREIILANEMVRQYSRDKILEIYLNDINYANQAYGIEAAAQTYFAKTAKNLTLGEASFVAGIPQSPVFWDPVANKKNTLRRQADVLRLMEKAGFIRDVEIVPAIREVSQREFRAPPANVSPIAPHFMQYVREQLDAQFGAAQLYRTGLRVYTTLDPAVQNIAEGAVREQMSKLQDKNVTNASVVVMDPRTGAVLALVGSADFYSDAIDGQVNVALMQRQPGSSIKPFTYLAALQKGWTASTLFWDTPKSYQNQYGQMYTPKNYDGKFHGGMLMREALARSMNIAAVDALNFVGVSEFLTFTQKFGIHFPERDDYGLAITLGGAESRLIDMTGAYAVLANAGGRIPPNVISKVTDAAGNEVCPNKTTNNELQTQAQNNVLSVVCRSAAAVQVVSPEHAFIVSSMLSDNAARQKSFGANSVLKLNFPAAVKTGTTNDFRDNLTLGYTPDLVVGVWVGNSNNSEMQGTTGLSGAAPIWNAVMTRVHDALKLPNTPFVQPAGMVQKEICTLGGREPSPNCPSRTMEFFKSDQLPLPEDELTEQQVAQNKPDLQAAQPANPSPTSNDIVISQPADGSVVPRGLLSIRGVVAPAGFQQYVVEYGDGDNPSEWKWISGPHLSAVNNDQLTQWGIENLPSGRYTLRVTVNTDGGRLVAYARFGVE